MVRREEFFGAKKRGAGVKRTCLYCNYRNQARFEARDCECLECLERWLEMMLIDTAGEGQILEL